MEIKNTTKLTKEISRTFLIAHYKKTILPITYITLIVFGALSAIRILEKEYETAFILFAFAVGINLFLWLVVVISQKSVNKSYLLIQQEPTYAYTFFENEFKIEETSANSSSDTTYQYNLLNSVLITDKLIALYINKINALVIDNAGFTVGTREDLINLLKQKIAQKKIKQ